MRHSFFSSGSGQSAEFLGLDNYIEVIGSEAFALAFGNSMKFLAVGLPLIMLLSYLIALLLQHQVDRHKLLKSVFLFPYIMPVAGTVLLINLLFSETGLANGLLSALGLPVQQWLRGTNAFWVMILLYLWKSTGYSAILLLAGLVTIPGEQYESADLDGASGWQKFCYITTPADVVLRVLRRDLCGNQCVQVLPGDFLIGGEHRSMSFICCSTSSTIRSATSIIPRVAVASVLLLIIIVVFFGVFYAFVNRKEAFRE